MSEHPNAKNACRARKPTVQYYVVTQAFFCGIPKENARTKSKFRRATDDPTTRNNIDDQGLSLLTMDKAIAKIDPTATTSYVSPLIFEHLLKRTTLNFFPSRVERENANDKRQTEQKRELKFYPKRTRQQHTKRWEMYSARKNL